VAPGWRATDHRWIAGTDSCIPATWHVVELTFEASANVGTVG
jgi:hypothetical protein